MFVAKDVAFKEAVIPELAVLHCTVRELDGILSQGDVSVFAVTVNFAPAYKSKGEIPDNCQLPDAFAIVVILFPALEPDATT